MRGESIITEKIKKELNENDYNSDYEIDPIENNIIVENKKGSKIFWFGSNIFIIQKTSKGFTFEEACDFYFRRTLLKEKALFMLNKAIEFIESNDFGMIPESKEDCD